uniref:Unkown protein n=1 Tax=Riptortus pedestris TaxID=329032 RepID=R4WST6_RIPPE|nr:unkown protein [Riptortus pedestris]
MCKSEVPSTPVAAARPVQTILHSIPNYNVSAMRPWRPSILRLVSPNAVINLNEHWEFFKTILTEDGRYRETPLAPTSEAQAAPDATEK